MCAVWTRAQNITFVFSRTLEAKTHTLTNRLPRQCAHRARSNSNRPVSFLSFFHLIQLLLLLLFLNTFLCLFYGRMRWFRKETCYVRQNNPMNQIYAALKTKERKEQKKSISSTSLFISIGTDIRISLFEKKTVLWSRTFSTRKNDFQHSMLLTPIVWVLQGKLLNIKGKRERK